MKFPFCLAVATVILSLWLCFTVDAQTSCRWTGSGWECSNSTAPLQPVYGQPIYSQPVRQVASRVVYAQPVQRTANVVRSVQPVRRTFGLFGRRSYSRPRSTASYGSSGQTMGYQPSAISYQLEAYSPQPKAYSQCNCDCPDCTCNGREYGSAPPPLPRTSDRAVTDKSLLADLRRLESERHTVAAR